MSELWRELSIQALIRLASLATFSQREKGWFYEIILVFARCVFERGPVRLRRRGGTYRILTKSISLFIEYPETCWGYTVQTLIRLASLATFSQREKGRFYELILVFARCATQVKCIWLIADHSDWTYGFPVCALIRHLSQ